MRGADTPASATRAAISGRAAAASSVLTVTRTSSEPAPASAMTCAAVDAASAVSVLVMDWTTIGCAEPTGTPPTLTETVRRRSWSDTTQPPSGAVNYPRRPRSGANHGRRDAGRARGLPRRAGAGRAAATAPQPPAAALGQAPPRRHRAHPRRGVRRLGSRRAVRHELVRRARGLGAETLTQ